MNLNRKYDSNGIPMADKKNPHTGVIVKMSNTGPKFNCSLAVSVLCNSNGVQVGFLFIYWLDGAYHLSIFYLQGPQAMERLGACDYVSTLFSISFLFFFLIGKF